MSEGTTETPFVLLHGGRHGGWCWRPVARLLRQRGHEVFTPTLTGLGERAHLLDRRIGLATHVQDLVGVFEYEDLENTVLVAHSYGGQVACGAMEQIADRVRSLVLLDAHLPKEGERVFDHIGPEREKAMMALVDEGGEGWRVPIGDASRYGVTDPVDAAWLNRHMTPQPVRTYQDPSGPTERAWRHPGMFIECAHSSQEPESLERARRRAKEVPGVSHRILDSTHNAMVTAPEAVTALLLEAAAQPVGVQGGVPA